MGSPQQPMPKWEFGVTGSSPSCKFYLKGKSNNSREDGPKLAFSWQLHCVCTVMFFCTHSWSSCVQHAPQVLPWLLLRLCFMHWFCNFVKFWVSKCRCLVSRQALHFYRNQKYFFRLRLMHGFVHGYTVKIRSDKIWSCFVSANCWVMSWLKVRDGTGGNREMVTGRG